MKIHKDQRLMLDDIASDDAPDQLDSLDMESPIMKKLL